MASESSITDQSINQQAEEKEVGDFSKNVDFEEIIFQPKEAAGKEGADNSKEEGLKEMSSTAGVSEEKLEPFSDLTKKDIKHEKVGERENSLEESEVTNSSELTVEANGGNLNSRADDAHEMSSEAREKSSDFVETSASQEPIISESKTEDLKDTEIKPTSENERKPDEAANTQSSKDKVYIELIKSEDSKAEIQVLDPAEISAVIVPDASDVPDKTDFDLGNATSIEVPVKDLEVESGSPEEQKLKESTETKELNSNVSTIDAGREDFGSSSYEVKPSKDAEAVDNKDDGLEVETMQVSAKIQEDPEAETKLAQIESDENVFQGVEVKKDDEIVEGGIETSTVPVDVPSLAEISSEEAKASEPGVVVEEETSLESDNIETVPKVAEGVLEDRNVLEGDKLVGKEKVVNAEAVQRDLVDTITDPTESEVSSVQVQAPTSTEIVDEALEGTSKQLNIAPEASGVFSEGDKISAGDLKSECLEGESATSMEAPADITTAEEQLDQVFEEKKIESSVSETQVPSKDKLAEKEDDGAHETPSVLQSDVAEKSASQEPAFPESKTEDLKDAQIKATSENDRKSEEAPLVSTGAVISKDGNIEDETQEAANPEFSKDKVDIELIKLEDSKDELQVLVPAETPGTVVVPDASETPEKNDIDSSIPTSIEVSVKNLEVDSGSPEEQKSNEKTETKELSSNVIAVNAGGEVVGFPSNEIKPSGDLEVIEKNDILEVEAIQNSAEIHEDLEAKPELAQTQSDEKVSVGVEVNRDDEIAERSIETPTIPDYIPLANVSCEEEKASEPAVVVEEEETSLEGNNIDTVPKMADVSFEGRNVLEGDKLVDNSAEAVERDLVDTITDPEEADVSFVQVKAPSTIEIGNEALEVTSKELDTTPEASVVPSEVDKLSASFEKSENLKGEAVTSVEAPKDISLDPVIEEKMIDSPVSERQAPSEDKLVDKEKDVNEEAKEINLQSQAAGTGETLGDVSSDFAETFASQEPVFSASKNEDLVKPASENERKQEETPLVSNGVDISEENNVMAEAQEAANPEFSKDKVDINLIESEGTKDEIQVLVPDEIPTVVAPHASETYKENDVDSSNFINIEAPVDPEIESGFLDEKKLKESTETNEPSSHVTAVDAGGEVVGSSSYELKPSEDAEAVEKKDDGLEAETVQTSAKIQEDLDAKPELRQTHSDENVSQGVEVKNDDEIAEGGIATSTVPDVPLLVKVMSEEEKAAEPSVMVVKEEASLESDNIDTVPVVAEVSSDGLDGDKLVEKGEVVNVEAVEIDLTDTFTDPTKAEISSDQVEPLRTTEIVNEALELTSQDLIVAPEANKVPAEVDKISAGDEEKSEATSVEAPKYITTVKDSLDQLSEEKNYEILVSEMAALTADNVADKEKNVNVEHEERDIINASTDVIAVEVSSEHVNSPEIVEEESDRQALEETSKELSIAPEVSGVPSVDDKLTAGEEKSESLKGEAGTSVEAPKDITIAEESLGQVIEKKNESSISDKSVDREKYVNEEAEERGLVDTFTDPIAAEVSSDQVKASGTAEIIKEESNKQSSKVTSNELNIASEASEIPCKGDEVSAGDEEKRVGLESEDATLVEGPKDITIAEESPVQVLEKSESSISEKETPQDNFVDKEKNVKEEAGGRDLVDTSTDPTAAEMSSNQVKASETAEIIKEESDKQAVDETSKEVNVASEPSEIHSKGDDISAVDEEKREGLESEDAILVEATKDIIIAEESPDPVPEKTESSVSEKEALPECKLVDKEKNVNEEAEERDLVGTSTHSNAAEVYSNQVKSSETAEIVEEESNEQPVDETSKELNVASEASEIHSKGDEVSAVDEEKREGLESEDPILVEAPKDIIIADESPDLVPEKTESSVSEKEALPEDKLVDKEKNVTEEAEERDLVGTSTDPTASEVYSNQVKSSETAEIVRDESNEQAVDETSKELNVASEASEIHSKGDEVSTVDEEKREGLESEDAVLVEAPKDIIIAEESPDPVPEKTESSVSEKEALPEDKLVDKEENVNEEAEERDLVGTSTHPTAAEVYSNQVKSSETAEIVKDESNEQAVDETSKELNVASEASEIPSKGDEVSVVDEEKREGLGNEDAILVEAPKDIRIAEDSPDPVSEKTESSVSEKEALPEDKLVDKEKNVNEEAEERDLVGTSIHPTAAEVYSNQVKSSETAEIVKEESNNQTVDETSKELNVASEASEIPSKGDEVSAVDEEKREGLESEDAILVEAPKDITIAEESPDPVSEKIESSVSEKKALPEDKLVDKEKSVNEEAEERDLVGTSTHPTSLEVYSETVEIVKEESNKQDLEETSKELNIASEATEIPSKGDEVYAGDDEKREDVEGEDATSLEAPKDITIAEESVDQVIEKSESSVSEKEALPEDNLVNKEKNVNEGAEERLLIDTSTDSVAGEVSFDQLKALESAEITEESNKQALEETSKELNIDFEASGVPSEGDKVSSGDEEKRESLNGDGDATLMAAPKDIIIAEESLDQVIEKESEVSTSEKEGLPEDKLVDKEKNANEEAEERVFVEAFTDPTAAEVSSDQVKASEVAEIIKEERNKQDSEETSKEFNIASDAGVVPSKGDEFSAGDETKRESLEGEDATLVAAPKYIIIAEESHDQGVEKKSESSTSEKGKLVDKERNVNEEVEERELVDTSIYPTIAEVSPSQVQASETADILKEASNKESLEIASKELNIASESSDVPTEVDKVSSGEEEHNESLKGEVATASEPPNAITENKNESSNNETEARIETTRDFDSSKLFPEAVKDIIASESVEEKQDETSNDLNVEEKKADDSEDKKEEVEITDKSEDEELVAVNAESEKSKDQDLIVSSDSRDVKLTKEVSKRESSIFSKVKRTIVKAKKAILRKSPGPKTVSSEAKD